MIKKIKGIILNSIDYKENHKISYVLTLEGKMSILIPRAKRFKEGLIADTQNLTLIDLICFYKLEIDNQMEEHNFGNLQV